MVCLFRIAAYVLVILAEEAQSLLLREPRQPAQAEDLRRTHILTGSTLDVAHGKLPTGKTHIAG
jgi:hypothetical protein